MKVWKKTALLILAIVVAVIPAAACFAEGETVYWGIDNAVLVLSAADTGCDIRGSFAADEAFDPETGRPWHEYNQVITGVRVDGSAGSVKIADCMDLFYDLVSLKDVDLNGLDTSGTASFWCMFDHCIALETVDLSMLDTSAAENMQGMFYQCAALVSPDLSGFDTRNVTNMYAMFAGCASLKTLDLSSFDTSKVENAEDMFADCVSLTEVKTGEGWTIGEVPAAE